MKRLLVAFGLSILSASACLVFGEGWMERTGLQVLVIVMIEAVAAVVAALLIALLSMKTMAIGCRRWGSDPVFRSIMVGIVLGPIAGALMGTLSVVLLRNDGQEAVLFWSAMIGVSRMFGLAGAIGGATFWFSSGRRAMTPRKFA